MHLIIKQHGALKSTGELALLGVSPVCAARTPLLSPLPRTSRRVRDCAETPSDDKTPKCNCVIC